MQLYRIYSTDQRDRIRVPPTDLEFVSDLACIQHLHELASESTGAEAWSGARLIWRVQAKGVQPSGPA